MSENNINLEAKDQPSEATTYGGLLRIARENKELSIDQVSSQLRISPDQIEGLESDNYKVFPTPVYARAHLRSYARLLGVDEAKIISLFNAALAPDDKDPRTFIRRTTQELAPYHDAQPKNFVGKFIAGLLFLAVVIALGWIGYMCASFSSFSFGGRCPAARHRLMHRRPANRRKHPPRKPRPKRRRLSA